MWVNFNASALTAADTENRGVAEGDGATFGLWNASDRLFYRDDSFIFSRAYWGRGNGERHPLTHPAMLLLPQRPVLNPYRVYRLGNLGPDRH